MLFPLMLTLLSHGKPLRPAKSAPSQAPFSKTAPETAVKNAVEFILLDSPPPGDAAASPTSRSLPPRRLMPQAAALRLDTRAQAEREETDLIAAINHERRAHGLAPLAEDPLLDVTARAHSGEMCRLGYFEHQSPLPQTRTPLDRYLSGLHAWGETRPESALVGENIFYASVSDATYNSAYAHTALMNSPGHRANILEPRFTKVGVGLFRDPAGRFWVTEMFLRDHQ